MFIIHNIIATIIKQIPAKKIVISVLFVVFSDFKTQTASNFFTILEKTQIKIKVFRKKQIK